MEEVIAVLGGGNFLQRQWVLTTAGKQRGSAVRKSKSATGDKHQCLSEKDGWVADYGEC